MIFNIFLLLKSVVVKLLYPALVLRIQQQNRLWREKKIIIRPILEKQGGLGLKNFHWGKYLKERHIDLLEYRFPYKHMQRIVSFMLSFLGHEFC